MLMTLPLLAISLPASAWPVIMLSMGMGVIIVALQYMIAYALSNPQLQAVAKEELAALIFSAFIILFWFVSDEVFNSMTNGLILSSIPAQYQTGLNLQGSTAMGWTNSHIEIAIMSLDITYQKLRSAYVDLYLFEALIGFLSTVTFPVGSPMPVISIISFSLSPFTGLALLSNAHTIVVEAISYLITVIWAKEFILYFARDCVPILLLPLGLALRAFPFFRTTGSSLIALCFAIYFVFPFSLILSNTMVFDYYGKSYELPVESFSYSPPKTSFFSTPRGASEWTDLIEKSRSSTDPLIDTFNTKDIAQEASTGGDCAGNDLVHYLCSAGNLLLNGAAKVKDFFSTVFKIWTFMMGFTGDFFTSLITNPALPNSASAGLYHFIIEEVNNLSPLVILITITTVLEIIFTVTMYRNLSLLMGGEAEIIGLTKIV